MKSRIQGIKGSSIDGLPTLPSRKLRELFRSTRKATPKTALVYRRPLGLLASAASPPATHFFFTPSWRGTRLDTVSPPYE